MVNSIKQAKSFLKCSSKQICISQLSIRNLHAGCIIIVKEHTLIHVQWTGPQHFSLVLCFICVVFFALFCFVLFNSSLLSTLLPVVL